MRGMFKILFSFLVLNLLTADIKAQGVNKLDWDRVVYGGSIFPSFSNLGTTIQANPFLGYKVTDKFVPGVMVSYQYVTQRNWPTTGLTTVYSAFGVGPFLRYAVSSNFFVQTEYEFLNGRYEVKPLGKFRFSENNLLIGGGYVNNRLFAQLMYMPTWRGVNSVYPSPLIYRVGFTIF